MKFEIRITDKDPQGLSNASWSDTAFAAEKLVRKSVTEGVISLDGWISSTVDMQEANRSLALHHEGRLDADLSSWVAATGNDRATPRDLTQGS